jgi:RNA polymerase primary sigma factor
LQSSTCLGQPAAKPEILLGELEPTDPSEDELDEDDLENSMSLAAIEAELKPKVLEIFDNIADSYKRLRRLQDQDIENKLKNQSLSTTQERKYKKLKDVIIAEVKSLRLNQARINSLVEQLYDINKRLVGYEGRMMRLAESQWRRTRGLPQELPRLGARSALAQPRLHAFRQGVEEPRSPRQ